ncbi:hypothetical protein KXI11_28610, partial [Bacillus cereus]|nr:hypothetical protein [Bacillus cereus]
KSIEFYRLSNDFYNENTHLVEIMDKEKDGSFKNKERGYGVFLVDIDGLKFALPLRSKMHIKHKDNFTTRIYKDKGKDVRHGLDYSKAIIITEERFVDTSRIFILENKSEGYRVFNIFDTNTDRLIATVPVDIGFGSGNIAVLPNGSKAYFTDSDSQGLYVMRY